MAEQRSYTGSFDNRWKFTGKELDEDTGLYYFGARFYNPSTSIWLSVDPLVEQTMDAYGYCYQNPLKFTDPTGMSPEWGEGGDPPTNSKQINSLINQINKESPNSSIYLLVQSSPLGEANDRQNANAGTMIFDIFTIQDRSTNKDTQLERGSFFITLTHGKGLCTGGNISVNHTNEVNASFEMNFSKDGKVGTADTLENDSIKELQVISNLINNLNQNVTINNSTGIHGTGPIDPNKTKGMGIMNGVTGPVRAIDFGNARISTIINSLVGAGANSNKLSRGTPTFHRAHEGVRAGTFIDFRINSGGFSNGTYKGNAPTNIDLGKFQIF